MPFGWIQFSVASSDLVDQDREDPPRLERRLRRDLHELGATLEGRLWFEADRTVAHAHVKDLDDPEKRNGLLRAYGASYWKLLTPEEAKSGRQQERRFRDAPPPAYDEPESAG